MKRLVVPAVSLESMIMKPLVDLVFPAYTFLAAYFSRYQVNHTYPCWYNPANPSQVSFVKGVNLWDYIWLFLWACWFLLDGVLLNVHIIRAVASSLSERRRRQSADAIEDDTSEDDTSEMDLL